MGVSIYSFFVSVLWTDVLILVLYALRRSRLITYYGVMPLVALILGCILRCFFPFEFSFTHIIHDTRWLQQVHTTLAKSMGTISIASIIVGIWICGAVVAMSIFIIHNIQFYCSYAKMPSCRNKKALKASQYVAQSLRVRKVRLICSGGFDMPMTTGLTRPVVMLPMVDYTDEELKYVLTHELTHWKNHDLWVKMIVQVLCAVFWWNPFVYLLRKDLDQTLELKCDLAVTGKSGKEERIKYLETILKTLRAASAKSLGPALTTMSLFGSEREEAKQRFRFVLQYRTNRKRDRILAVITCTLLACSLFVSYSFILQPKYDPPVSEFGGGELTPENAYILRHGDGKYSLIDEFGTETLEKNMAEMMVEQGFPIREER